MPLLDLLLSGGVAVAIVGIISKYLEHRWNSKAAKPKASTTVIKTVASIYQSMQKVLMSSNVERILILKVENGGGKPKVGAHIYASAIMEVQKDPRITVLDNYQRLRADAGYVELLADLLTKEHVIINVSELPDCLLKTIYKAENIKYSEVYYLHATDEAIYYCSFATSQDEQFNDAKTQLAIEVAVNHITEILKANV